MSAGRSSLQIARSAASMASTTSRPVADASSRSRSSISIVSTENGRLSCSWRSSRRSIGARHGSVTWPSEPSASSTAAHNAGPSLASEAAGTAAAASSGAASTSATSQALATTAPSARLPTGASATARGVLLTAVGSAIGGHWYQCRRMRRAGLPAKCGVMLSIDEARAAVLAEVRPLEDEEVAIGEALGRVLAQDIAAVADVPGFANSAMDGFAVRSGPAGRRLLIAGESRAGAPASASLADGEAIRISTGAMLPDGADAVLQIELVDEDVGSVVLNDDVAPGRNVRHPGEDMRAGTTVLRS